MSINNSETGNTPRLYPQPSNNLVSISNLPVGDYKYYITSIGGKSIKSGNLENTIDVSSLASGIYMIKVIGANQTFNFKCIIK